MNIAPAAMGAFCAPVQLAHLSRIDRRRVDTPRATRLYHRSACPRATIRDIPLVTVPMTSGGDVLFPGGMQQIMLNDQTASRLLETTLNSDPPEFAHIVINAWNEPGTVGTIATVEELSTSSNVLHCTGLSRFRVLHLAEDYSSARVETFQDDPPEEHDLDKLQELEKELLQTMASIVSLSLKIAGEDRQKALAETLRRVEAFCGMNDDDRHWLQDLDPDRRRELLSFIVIDLLSISFMNRREILASTDTAERLEHAQKCLQPFVNELAAKGAIVSALGHEDSDN